MSARGTGLRSMRKDPSSWSAGALELYQRARSSDVTITYADGSSRTVNKWAVKPRRKRHSSKS